jgi:hypothetical protein
LDKELERAREASDTFHHLMQHASQDSNATDYLPEYLAHRISDKPELMARLVPGNHLDDIRAIDAILDKRFGPVSFDKRRDILIKAYAFVKNPANAPKACGAAYFDIAADALGSLTVDDAVALTSRVERLREAVEIHLHVGFPLFEEDDSWAAVGPLHTGHSTKPGAGR